MKPDAPIAYADEDEELLFGPTARPDDKMGKQLGTRAPAPKGLERYAKVFAEALRDPNAPKEMVNFARVLSYHLGRDL
jgi:hypothetical protein